MYEKTIYDIENRKQLPKGHVYLMTKDFHKDVVELAKDMASLSDVEVSKYIKNEVSIPKQQKSKIKDLERWQ